MPAYKNKENGSWYVVTQYTDWTGERKPKCKRGFATRREALEWEQKFQQQSAGDLDFFLPNEMSKTDGKNCPQTRQLGIERAWGVSRAQKP